jgi:hypothetical protein
MPGLFRLGRITVSNQVFSIIREQGRWEVSAILRAHASGYWGELDREDIAQNERKLATGGKLFSAFTLLSGSRIWITTEGDRSLTLLTTPEEYIG